MNCFRFYCCAIGLAWTGNACYAAYRPGQFLHDYAPLPVALALILFSATHGTRRYGAAGAAAFFGIVVSLAWAVETLGVNYGVPFGRYHYADSMQPFVGQVPLSVLFAYFAMSYPSWTLALMIAGRLDRLDRPSVNVVAMIAALLMVFWDLSMDPLRSTIEGRWIWHDAGSYLGIPATNFLGWFLTAWLMFRLFGAWVLAHGDRVPCNEEFGRWPAWVVCALMYLGFTAEYLLNPFLKAGDAMTAAEVSASQVYEAAALSALLTMLPAAALGIFQTVRLLGARSATVEQPPWRGGNPSRQNPFRSLRGAAS